LETINNEDVLQAISPRTKFLTSCLKDQINPRPSLLLRKNVTTTLNLTHQGITDVMAKSLAKSFEQLPFIEEINIADNMLTDVGLTMIIRSVYNITTLKILHLSQNKMETYSAKSLRDYLSMKDCPLEKLFLHSCNIDDVECSHFINAIEQNHKLEELDLSKNNIGRLENSVNHAATTSASSTSPVPHSGPSSSSSVSTSRPASGRKPHHPLSGAHAIANLLRSSLKTLNLQWNLIRYQGAIELSQSLSFNQSLLHLDLSYNTLGTDASIALGSSLILNKTLISLNLAYCSIDAMGCITICSGIIENISLSKIILDGNPIGEQGGKALLLTTIFSINQVTISALKCNISLKDSKCWFDFDNLSDREYSLNMENGYDRAIMIFLLHIVAGQSSYHFDKILHETVTHSNNKGGVVLSPVKGQAKSKPIELITSLYTIPSQFLNEKQQSIISSLEKVDESLSDYHTAALWFEEIDMDGNGTIELSEFVALMKKLGVELNDRRLHQLFKKYDIDGSGKLDMSGFLTILKHQKKEAINRKHDLLNIPIMTLGGSLASESSFSSSSSSLTPYVSPDSGILHFAIINDFSSTSTKLDFCRILTSYHCDLLVAMLHQFSSSTNLLSLLSSCLEIFHLRLNEAIIIADLMLMETSDKIEIVRKILFSMVSSYDTSHFLNIIFGENRQEVMRLKWDYNFLLKPLLGCPNGYYCLDLKKSIHRKSLMKLLEHNTRQSIQRMKESSNRVKYGLIGDLSQNGNFSCFRNELLDGKLITINASFISALPRSGKLEFDFSSTERPPLDGIPLDDKKLIKILLKHSLLKSKDVGIAMFKLEEWKQYGKVSLSCKGNTQQFSHLFESSKQRVNVMGTCRDHFYNYLTLRSEQLNKTKEKICHPVRNDKEGEHMLERDNSSGDTLLPSIESYLRDSSSIAEEEQQFQQKSLTVARKPPGRVSSKPKPHSVSSASGVSHNSVHHLFEVEKLVVAEGKDHHDEQQEDEDSEEEEEKVVDRAELFSPKWKAIHDIKLVDDDEGEDHHSEKNDDVHNIFSSPLSQYK
jgi:Ran GTPase-activating protein (RanGAP) involved in mRNA processing and transport